MKLVRVVQTSSAAPLTWDAWTSDGQLLHLRYRFGVGTVTPHDADEPATRFGRLSMQDREITLQDFCERAGLHLAPDPGAGTGA
ncbi:hypothetical protein [Streptomyces iconiensis]|uniref:Uncharacterized protein n=1 Tax=Streptomyces iconiensis TaxID=1384038 RepID=A0ABT7A966_9ACTN|nr:hypothetical protein [Streptomyces iconiensis]MDJ1137577.1 hypothetical protein [Streptomyces iconiensis]